MAIKARWEQIAVNTGMAPGSYSGAPTTHAVAVDEDDEIIAMVAGNGQTWSANTMYTGQSTPKQGSFLNEEAAKRRVEKWMHPQYTFQAPGTAWVYKVSP